jgi:hypothetical protein
VELYQLVEDYLIELGGDRRAVGRQRHPGSRRKALVRVGPRPPTGCQGERPP